MKDFTKRTSERLDLQAEVRLRLVLMHTKRTIAASVVGVGGSAATCAVESLKDELDYTDCDSTWKRCRYMLKSSRGDGLDPGGRGGVCGWERVLAWAGRCARSAPAQRCGDAIHYRHRRGRWDRQSDDAARSGCGAPSAVGGGTRDDMVAHI